MENDERQENGKKAERLAKRKERRRKQMLEETADERDSRLKKRREAWKKRTAEAKGKQNEFKKVYRQQKEASESVEEREVRLAKRRQAWQDRSVEAKGKRKEYNRLYRQQKRATELPPIAEEREIRLAKRREAMQKRNAEKGRQQGAQKANEKSVSLDEAMGTNVFATEASEDSVYVYDANAVSVVDQCVLSHESMNEGETRAVSIAGEESGSVPEAEGVSKNEYLHEGGWQNADSPLHEQEFVQNEMHSFHLDQERLEHRQCTICKEAWPTRQNLTSETYTCYRCKRDKKSPKKFSAENDMDPGIVPGQLRGLIQVEEMLISRVCPIMRVYRKHGGQRGYKGHTCIEFTSRCSKFFE